MFRLLFLATATIGKINASEKGVQLLNPPLQGMTTVCYNNEPAAPWLVGAVQRAQAVYIRQFPWRNNFFLVQEENNFICQNQAAYRRRRNFFSFVDAAYHPAFTDFYTDANTFAVTIDLTTCKTLQTIHVLLLHEIGHVMGLEHVSSPDGIMSYQFLMQENLSFLQEMVFLSLTKQDIEEISRTEISDYHAHELDRAFAEAPSSLSSQRIIKCM